MKKLLFSLLFCSSISSFASGQYDILITNVDPELKMKTDKMSSLIQNFTVLPDSTESIVHISFAVKDSSTGKYTKTAYLRFYKNNLPDNISVLVSSAHSPYLTYNSSSNNSAYIIKKMPDGATKDYIRYTLDYNKEYQPTIYVDRGDEWYCPITNGFVTGISFQSMPHGICHSENDILLNQNSSVTVNNENYVQNDWAPNWLKRQCPSNYAITGYSGDGNYIQCSKIESTLPSKPCRTIWFNQYNNGYQPHMPYGTNGDWAYNSYKGEVKKDEYIAGVASYVAPFQSRYIEAVLACPLR